MSKNQVKSDTHILKTKNGKTEDNDQLIIIIIIYIVNYIDMKIE